MTTLKNIEERFDILLGTVKELAEFDKLILDFCISHIESLNHNLKNGPFKIGNPSFLADKALLAISNVRQNNSLRTKYQSIFNSCVVLQVSYFTSAIQDIFYYAHNRLVITNRNTITADELKKRNDINFQNMASIIKTYKKYLDIDIATNSTVNTIALSQFCRHATVHSLSLADEKFIFNIKNLQPRDIKRNITLGEKIEFTTSELEYVKLAMQMFISDLVQNIGNRHGIS